MVLVNSILNNSEQKIFFKFCEALNLKQVANKNQTVELITEVQELFQRDQKNLCILFILEDVDSYIESSK